jgi:hypothetical protein
MKKLFAGMVVSIMLIGMMGTTVFAAKSPNSAAAVQSATDKATAASNAANISSKNIAVYDSNHNNVTVTPTVVDPVTWAEGTNAATSKFGSDATVIAATELGTKTVNGTVTVRLNVSDKLSTVRSTDVVHVLHLENGAWVDIATLSGKDLKANGYIILSMSSFSPIMVVCVPATAASQKDDTQNSTQDSTQNSTEAGSQNDQNTSSGSAEDYTQGYNDGYEAGVNSVSNISSGSSSSSSKTGNASKSKTSKSSSSSGNSSKTGSKTVTRTIYRTGNTTTSPVNTSTTSPKTGASLPALPFVAVFAFAGLLVCNKKGHNQ